jgi:electron transport complex protein RnfG
METTTANTNIRDYIRPTISLVLIALVVTVLLALTYSATKPMIEKLQKERADAAREEVLPDANGFTEITLDTDAENVEDIYTADNGSGTVVTVTDKGFGGNIRVMVGLDAGGRIVGVKVLSHTETPGLGTKAMTEEYLAQYKGAVGVKTKKLDTDRADATEIDTISGATITSNAVYRAVNRAVAFVHQMGESNG